MTAQASLDLGLLTRTGTRAILTHVTLSRMYLDIWRRRLSCAKHCSRCTTTWPGPVCCPVSTCRITLTRMNGCHFGKDSRSGDVRRAGKGEPASQPLSASYLTRTQNIRGHWTSETCDHLRRDPSEHAGDFAVPRPVLEEPRASAPTNSTHGGGLLLGILCPQCKFAFGGLYREPVRGRVRHEYRNVRTRHTCE